MYHSRRNKNCLHSKFNKKATRRMPTYSKFLITNYFAIFVYSRDFLWYLSFCLFYQCIRFLWVCISSLVLKNLLSHIIGKNVAKSLSEREKTRAHNLSYRSIEAIFCNWTQPTRFKQTNIQSVHCLGLIGLAVRFLHSWNYRARKIPLNMWRGKSTQESDFPARVLRLWCK